MITKHDLESAIAECQGKKNPDARTCIMLASFYTIKREMFGEEIEHPQYSFAPAPEYYSDSEFSRMISGKSPSEFLPIIDELMSTLRVLMPRLYDAVLDKLS